MAHAENNDLPVVADIKDFDAQSGTFLEKLFFNNRVLVVSLCAIATVVFGYFALQLEIAAGFEKQLPKEHPYVLNYNEHRGNLPGGLGNNLRVVVSTTADTIYTKEFLKVLELTSEELFFIPGVDRNSMKSLFTPNTRWKVVTEEGFAGGPVVPGNYDGSPETIEALKTNVQRAGITGDLIANNEKSSAIIVPLRDINPETGEPLDYADLNSKVEAIRAKFTGENVGDTELDKAIAAAGGPDMVDFHVIGFAKMVGDLIEGIKVVMGFFAAAVAIATLLLYLYTHCFRSTLMTIACTVIAVVWQLGILRLLGYSLDPFSILVPFLVFAIGVSHGAQKLNGVLQDMGRGTCAYVAARYTFRRLFLAGVTALLSDGVGFAVMMIIAIQVIQDLAITASIGVLVLIFTNLILTPILLSYTGVGKKAVKLASRPHKSMEEMNPMWRFLLLFTKKGPAGIAITISVIVAIMGLQVTKDLKIGDLDPGAPELRPDSRYNQDVAYMSENYSVSTDIFAVIVNTPPDTCAEYDKFALANELEWRLRQLEGVDDVRGLNTRVRTVASGVNEGYPKWNALFANQGTINYAVSELVTLNMVDPACSTYAMMVYLADHKAETLTRVVNTLESFREEFGDEGLEVEFMGAAGSAGFAAATNIVVKKANTEMLYYVYAAVTFLCMLTFRSVTGVVCAILPLMFTSICCEALMVFLGMGVKVATLPVIALGVGIGVDYALYVLTVILQKERAGLDLTTAYYETINFTGRVVALIGVTLASGVITWFWSPIKFQADMGLLLAFMFIWNMFGALILMPSLAAFLIKHKEEEAPA